LSDAVNVPSSCWYFLHSSLCELPCSASGSHAGSRRKWEFALTYLIKTIRVSDFGRVKSNNAGGREIMLVSVELALVVLALFVGPGASKWAEGTNRVYVRKGGGSCDGRASDCTLWTSATQMKGDMERMVSQAAKEQEENYAAVKRVRPDFAVRVRLGSMRCSSGGGAR
jgi:hypothetical protein